MCCLNLDPKPCGQQIIGGNLEKTEPNENFISCPAQLFHCSGGELSDIVTLTFWAAKFCFAFVIIF